jgi:hypothetical protein
LTESVAARVDDDSVGDLRVESPPPESLSPEREGGFATPDGAEDALDSFVTSLAPETLPTLGLDSDARDFSNAFIGEG